MREHLALVREEVRPALLLLFLVAIQLLDLLDLWVVLVVEGTPSRQPALAHVFRHPHFLAHHCRRLRPHQRLARVTLHHTGGRQRWLERVAAS